MRERELVIGVYLGERDIEGCRDKGKKHGYSESTNGIMKVSVCEREREQNDPLTD